MRDTRALVMQTGIAGTTDFVARKPAKDPVNFYVELNSLLLRISVQASSTEQS